MIRTEIEDAFGAIKEADDAWARAQVTYRANVDSLMTRLLLEALRNKMSVAQIATALGRSPSYVRQQMRDRGLDAWSGANNLSKAAAEALAENSAILGIDPREMDLMSPLAYLPMGHTLRQEFLETHRVTELPDEADEERRVREVAWLFWCVSEGYKTTEDRAFLTNWMLCSDDELTEGDIKTRAAFSDMARTALALLAGEA